MTTPERLTTTIRLALFGVDVQAVMTRFRSVCRIYQYQFYPKLNALIGQELPQLVEAPRVTSTSLYLGSRQFICTLHNARKVFECNNLVIGSSLLYQLIANGVIDVALKASLLARQPFLKLPTPTPTTSRAFRSFVLEFCSQITVMVANFRNIFPAIFVSNRCNNNVCPTQIATQNFVCSFYLWWLRLKLNIYVVRAILPLQQCGCFRCLPFNNPRW
jgi:hypothetical protein